MPPGLGRTDVAPDRRRTDVCACSPDTNKEPIMTKPAGTTPFAIGLLSGAAIISILGFANDWVVTAKASEAHVMDARTDVRGAICAALAHQHLRSKNLSPELEGYTDGPREARDKLAQRFSIRLPGETSVDPYAVSACAHELNKPSS